MFFPPVVAYILHGDSSISKKGLKLYFIWALLVHSEEKKN